MPLAFSAVRLGVASFVCLVVTVGCSSRNIIGGVSTTDGGPGLGGTSILGGAGTGGEGGLTGNGGALGVGGTQPGGTPACTDPLTIADPYVESQLRMAINVPSGPIHPADVVGLTELAMIEPAGTPIYPPPAGYVGPVGSLGGIECFSNLRAIYFEAYFVDLTPLSRLPNLTVLQLFEGLETNVPLLPRVTEFRGNIIPNTAAMLSALPSLRVLDLVGADVSTVEARAALSALTRLTTLRLPGAGLTDTGPLAPLSLLTVLDLNSNHIQDISSLRSLPSLWSLDLSFNQITDLSPLVGSASFGFFGGGATIALGGNPIDCTTQARNIERLRTAGVTLTVDCP